ncbi:hypothetical protein [Tateyamaria sp.]
MMPVTKSTLPFRPSADMTLLEITACMGELLEWAASARTKQLLKRLS